VIDPMQDVEWVNSETFATFWTWLSEQDFVACDTETAGGYNSFDPAFKVRLVQFGSPERAWCVDFQRWRGFVQEVFDRFRGTFVFHNVRFDILALAAEGITVPWSQVADTLIMLRLAEPTESAALKKASDKYVSSASSGAQKILADAFRKQKWDWGTVPMDFQPYTFYAALDTILTARLYETDVAVRGRSSPVYAMEMEVKAVCTRMEQNGLKVDVGFCEREVDRLRSEADGIKESTMAEYGFSLGSTQQLSHWFASQPAALKLMTKETDGGKLAVDKDVLEVLLTVPGDVGEIARRTLRVRRDEKIAGSYLENFLGMRDHQDIVHPQIETVAARTGRMSVKEPGLQTLPKPTVDSEYRIVREAVIPHDDDSVLISCDSDQIELRIIGSITHDENMVEAFREADEGDTDFFTNMARKMYDDPLMPKSDKRRDRIKTFVYSSVYGAGIPKMALVAGVTVAEMREIRDGIAASFPGFFRIALEARHQLSTNGGYIETTAGRRLPCDKEHAAANYIIQGSAADVLKQSLVNAAQAGLEEYMLVPVHDEIVMSAPKDLADDLRRELEIAMTNVEYEIPLTASGNIGSTWAECK